MGWLCCRRKNEWQYGVHVSVHQRLVSYRGISLFFFSRWRQKGKKDEQGCLDAEKLVPFITVVQNHLKGVVYKLQPLLNSDLATQGRYKIRLDLIYILILEFLELLDLELSLKILVFNNPKMFVMFLISL